MRLMFSFEKIVSFDAVIIFDAIEDVIELLISSFSNGNDLLRTTKYCFSQKLEILNNIKKNKKDNCFNYLTLA